MWFSKVMVGLLIYLKSQSNYHLFEQPNLKDHQQQESLLGASLKDFVVNQQAAAKC